MIHKVSSTKAITQALPNNFCTIFYTPLIRLTLGKSPHCGTNFFETVCVRIKYDLDRLLRIGLEYSNISTLLMDPQQIFQGALRVDV